jgi:hypothetical protein
LLHPRRQSQQRIGFEGVGFQFTDFREQKIGCGTERCGALCQRCRDGRNLIRLDRLNRDRNADFYDAIFNRWRLASGEGEW